LSFKVTIVGEVNDSSDYDEDEASGGIKKLLKRKA
jgi:hypothetical protein